MFVIRHRSAFTAIFLIGFFVNTVFGQRAEKKPPRERPDTEIGNLLDDLEDQNKGNGRFTDPWLENLQQVVDVGHKATPELIKELDYTNDNMTMRCMGFTMRAMGDKRAIPALIRAIPKTLIKPGSDMGLRVLDEELETFAHEHELGDHHEPGRYGFGRPVREIFGALHKLTGENFEDEQLFSIFLSGNEHQIKMKRDLFHRQAAKWAEWWEANAEKFDVGEEFRAVNLPKHKPTEAFEPSFDVSYKTDSGGSNWMLEPLQTADARTVFFDFDTARSSRMPKQWRAKENLKPGDRPAPIKEMLEWAASEGYDMMGEEMPTEDGKTVYAIRLIGIKAVQLPMEQWQKDHKDTSLEELIASGTPHKGDLLFRHDQAGLDPYGHAPFLIVTREGTPGILSLGIEVRDDSQKPGGTGPDDSELDPVAFSKGRRFGFKFLVPEEE